MHFSIDGTVHTMAIDIPAVLHWLELEKKTMLDLK